ncbi:MAG: hypothetical protein ACK5L7_06065 [Paludibacteraceae bacterium]
MYRTKLIHYFYLPLLVVLLATCNKATGDDTDIRLAQMDSLVYKYPQYVYTHIDSIPRHKLSEYNLAYQRLIKIIATEKTGNAFHTDSVVNGFVEEFSRFSKRLSQNYLRGLLYQGVVRFQAGISDSKAYEPIKKALSLSDESDASRGLKLDDKQTAYYYLGVILNKNNDVGQSHKYLKQALFVAEILKDSTILFKTYRELYWNRIKALDFFTAKSILETLQNFRTISDEQIRDVRNAESVYHNAKKRYRNALKIDYELLEADTKKGDKESILSDYFRISENYKFLHRLDSALYYGELAITNIADTSYYLNYYYYLNVAEIASQMKNYQKSSEAYRQVYSILYKTITNRLNTHILELERKYDVSETQRKAMKWKSDNMWLQFTIMMLVFIFIVTALIYRNIARARKDNERYMAQENRILEQEMKITEEHEKQLELEKQLAERKLVEKQFVLPIFHQISRRNLDVKNLLSDLKNHAYISKNSLMLERIESEYKNYVRAIKINDNQFLNDTLFLNLTGIEQEQSKLFNDNEKMMLAFIATGSDNQQMAILFNSSIESIRVRKSKLKKKMEENRIEILDIFKSEGD